MNQLLLIIPKLRESVFPKDGFLWGWTFQSLNMFSFCARSLTWLSPSSLKSAEAKLANMVDLIGYPKLVLNTTWLDSVYSDVEVSDDDYLVNCKICSIRQTLCTLRNQRSRNMNS